MCGVWYMFIIEFYFVSEFYMMNFYILKTFVSIFEVQESNSFIKTLYYSFSTRYFKILYYLTWSSFN